MPALSRERQLAGPLRLPGERRLRTGERARLAGEILLAYGAATVALRRAPIETALAGLRNVPAGSAARDDALSESRRLGAAVSRTLRLAPGDTRCLTRSLVLTRLLARRGIASTLVIGTRTKPVFLAHAWVEHARSPVLDPGEGVFARLVEL